MLHQLKELLSQANDQAKKGNYQNAIIIYRQALNLAPDRIKKGIKFSLKFAKIALSTSSKCGTYLSDEEFAYSEREHLFKSVEGYISSSNDDLEKKIKFLFDEDWYVNKYLIRSQLTNENEAFDHYLSKGVQNKYNPNAWFDEEWYVSYYPEIQKAINNGICVSGFIHFLQSGHQEGRLPYRNSKLILESKFPSVTKPNAIKISASLEEKLKKRLIEHTNISEPRLNFVIPTLDKDIMFGGYASVLQLIKATQKLGFRIRILVTEDHQLSTEYALYNLSILIGKDIAKNIEFLNITHRSIVTPISNNDRFIAYSAWTALIASDFASYTDESKILFLIQEDERIFHHNDSIRAILESAYDLPHIPLFNSQELLNYFRDNRLGVFNSAENIDYFYFSHVLTKITPPTEATLFRNNSRKRLLFYARPESHAGRNLFEIGLLAIKDAIKKGHFDSSWSFDGVGSFAPNIVDLGCGNNMKLMPKLEGGAYGELLKNYDIGLSLMYAPHPGLVHFEMAAAGMCVVVNEYSYRNHDYFKNKSKNFIVSKPTIHNLSDALHIATIQSQDIHSRITHSSTIPQGTDWENTFNKSLLKNIFKLLNAL